MAATDTRVSKGGSILSRDHSKTVQLTPQCILTSAGMVADVEALHKNLLVKIRQYRMQQKRDPGVENIAQLLSTTLYSRRFMPFYAFNLLCGITKEGQGIVYGYDAIGSYGSEVYGAQGSGNSMGMTVLDNQFDGHNHLVKKLPESQEEVENTLRDILNSVAERDVYTGDNVELVVCDKNGVSRKRFPLRRD
jgi:20S proteasome subunit beta 6